MDTKGMDTKGPTTGSPHVGAELAPPASSTIKNWVPGPGKPGPYKVPAPLSTG